jgi:CRP-like cAMP-binding protein/DNA-binding NarL/FixJ family response regulator
MKTILLIEDDAAIRENTAELLELAGFAVLTAADGQLGVEQALATRPDLVVCDIMMPVLDGYGVLQIFNQNARLAGVPFIFLTAKTERTDLRRGMELGADDYLTKPFDRAELLSAITGRLHRFQHLKPEYDLKAEGLTEFLDDARAVGNLAGLSTDRKAHSFRKKQDVYREGDEATRVYFVQTGRVKTVKTTDGGKELITGLYGPGEFFGYLSILDRTPHPDSAVTVDDAELVYISQDDFTQLLLRNSAVGQQFIRLLAGRVNARETQLLAMAYSSIRRRVADTLLRLHEQAGAEASIQLSRDDMAAMVGTAPESLIRTLSEFRADGLVEVMPKCIRVLEPEKLRRARW